MQVAGYSSTPGTVSWRDLRREAATALATALGGDRQQEARWLVERVSGYTPTELIVNDTEPVSARSVAYFDQLLARRCSGEPLQYVLGRWSFRSLELIVNPSVLIPRPETELVAGLAIDAAAAAVARNAGRSPVVPVVAVDLGTGSGAIALSIVTEVAGTLVWATDASAAALATARANLAGIGRDGVRVTMTEGSWFEALPPELCGHIDVLVSNPPYVAPSMKASLPVDVVDYEPHDALFADEDGRADLYHIISLAPVWLAPGGTLVLEMSPEQTSWAADRLGSLGFEEICVHNDFTDRARAVVAQKAGS
jgi:release factor glutamine methyltransferase